MLGSSGEHLRRLAFGQDDRPVVPNWEARSVSNETTFEVDTDDRDLLLRTLRMLSESVGRRLRRDDLRARRITLKLRYEDFETHTKQVSLARPTQSDDEIVSAATALLDKFPLDRKIRLLGVGSSEFIRKQPQPAQLDLFARPEPKSDGKLDRTVDEIRSRFGNSSLRRGSQI